MWTSMQVLSLPVDMVVDFAERRCHFHLEIYISPGGGGDVLNFGLGTTL